jgi:predicted nucleotidyltransferase
VRFAERLTDLGVVAPSLQLVVVFGSAARGRSRPDNDVDVAVLCDGPADLDTLYLLLAPRLATDALDLTDLRRAGSLLALQVARQGRALYERHAGVFRSFQSLASRRYCDTDKLRRAQRRSIHAFLERHGLE